MRTAIDTSALYSIINAESNAESWMQRLIEARRAGQLIVCEVVFAELAPAYASEAELQAALVKLGISFDAVQPTAAFLAGQSFKRYRSHGGPRESMIPDFIIAAHAQVQADRLAAEDRGYFRTYFKSLPLITI